MSQEWRHLKMLKWAGHSFYPDRVNNTAEGQCTVLCLACPHPGKNLPSDCHTQCEPNKRWLYALFVVINANFQLKCKKVSKDSVDPSLSKGWSYFVEEGAYKAYLDKQAHTVQEKSTCASHSAINMVDTQLNQGLSATGVGTVDCAHHNMKLLMSIGDLQKGKKYPMTSLANGTSTYGNACPRYHHLYSLIWLPQMSHFLSQNSTFLDTLKSAKQYFPPISSPA
ncbi:hypothetical protein JVU11DRAFT_435 [Chiua virens]|nr:hypothetical protein JVU11DRAFT_435 [Chiua virens]